jgi:hypothetical protein
MATELLVKVPQVWQATTGGDDRLGDGARAVGDGQRGRLGNRVRLAAVGDLSGLRAVGGVHVDNLGDDSGVAGIASRGASSSGEDGGNSELHLVGIR